MKSLFALLLRAILCLSIAQAATKSDKWTTETIVHQDGTKDIIKWRYSNWHKERMTAKK